jgi:hypothetical protein
MALTRKDKEWLFQLAKAVVEVVDGSYASSLFVQYKKELLPTDEDGFPTED